MDKRYAKLSEQFDEFLAANNVSKSTAKNRAMLEAIGADKLRAALGKISLQQLYGFLRRKGFVGAQGVLSDMLAAMGVREKQAKPEALTAYNCRFADCFKQFGKQKLEKIPEGYSGEGYTDKDYYCPRCGRIHRKDGRKIVIVGRLPAPKKNENSEKNS